MTICLDREVLDRFVAGTAGGRERRQVVRHLLAGCGPCAALLRSAVRPAVEEGAYDGALARMTAQAWVREVAHDARRDVR
jgi:hypothetical protein